MTSARAYRRARPAGEALRELWRCAGTEYHAEIVGALATALPGVTSETAAEACRVRRWLQIWARRWSSRSFVCWWRLAARAVRASRRPASASTAPSASTCSAAQNTVDRPNIVVDVTPWCASADGWLVYVRPWFRQPRTPEWDKEIYQAAIQYERPGRVSTRVDLGYIVSPIGLGHDRHASRREPDHRAAFELSAAMPVFDPRRRACSADRVHLSARRRRSRCRRPLGRARRARQFGADAHYVINGGDANPARPRRRRRRRHHAEDRPAVRRRNGAGVLRTWDELTTRREDDRRSTMVDVEGEYAFGYTKIAGEFTHDRFERHRRRNRLRLVRAGHADTVAAWFVAARQEGCRLRRFAPASLARAFRHGGDRRLSPHSRLHRARSFMGERHSRAAGISRPACRWSGPSWW